MKNYWLDKNKFTNLELEEAVVGWKNSVDLESLPRFAEIITKKILVSYPSFVAPNQEEKEEEIGECVRFVCEKINKFDPTKGVAFNFCTTLIMSMLRQLKQVRKYREKPYAKSLATKKN